MADQQQVTADGQAAAVEKMGLRSIGGHALIYGIGMLANRAVGFVMLPVYTRYLSPADYGIINLVEMTFDVLSIIAGSRLVLGVYRFYHKADNTADRKRVVSTALLLTSLLALPIGLLAVATSGPLSELVFRTPDRSIFFLVAGLTFVVHGFQIVPFAYLQLQNRSKHYVAFQMARMVIQVILNVTFLVGFGLGPIAILASSLIANIVITSILVAIVVRDCGLGFGRGEAVDLARYGAPLMLTQVATFIITFGDRYFLQYIDGEAAVGLYSLSYQFGFLLGMLAAAPFQMVWNPVRFDIVKRDDRDEMHARAFLFFNVLLFALATGIGLFVGDALRILTTPEFHVAADVVPLILLAYVFHSWMFQDIGILVTEKTGYIALTNWISAAVIVGGYVLLIPAYSNWGAAIATLVAMTIRWAMTYAISQRLLFIRYRWRPVLILFAISVVIVLVGLLLPTMRLVPSLTINTILFLVWVGSIPLLGVLSRDEIHSMVSWVAGMFLPLWHRWRHGTKPA